MKILPFRTKSPWPMRSPELSDGTLVRACRCFTNGHLVNLESGSMVNRDAMLQYLRNNVPVIAPSMLKCDFGHLDREVQSLDSVGLPLLHLDVMDGHFVPNLSYGAMVIRSLRQLTSIPFDAHLMISEPARYLDDFLNAGCEAITVHIEAVPEPADLLRSIRDRDVVAGLAVNPETPIEAAEPWLGLCDLLLVMSVQPGFGGQEFIPDVVPKIQRARELAGESLLISVDGGIDSRTIATCAAAGADIFVAGSSVFDQPDYGRAGQELLDSANRAQALAKGST